MDSGEGVVIEVGKSEAAPSPAVEREPSADPVADREALARIIRLVGIEPHKAELDRLIRLGARAYWVEVPRASSGSEK